jgi:hypothetical protein
MSVCKDVICVVGGPSWDIQSTNYNSPLVKKVKLFLSRLRQLMTSFAIVQTCKLSEVYIVYEQIQCSIFKEK